MVAIAGASALIQYINSEEGRRLQKEERQRLETLIDKLQSPRFDTAMLSPPELRVLETYTPEVAEMVYEASPELTLGDSDRAQDGKAAEDSALNRFQEIVSGRDPNADVAVIKALNDAIEASGRNRDTVLRDMARQGINPSSSEYAQLQFGAANNSQKNMFDTSLNAALAGQARRDRALGDSANLGGKIAGYETDLERLNDSTVNQLNQRNTQARRQYLTNRANVFNQAQQKNIDQRQNIYETNANSLFEAQKRRQDASNKQTEANYRTETDKIQFKTGNSRMGDIASASQDRNQAIQGVSNAALMATLLASQNEQKVNREVEQKA